MIAEASAQPLVEQQEQQHPSDKDVQEMKDSLNQAETKIKALEGQIENLQKVFCEDIILWSACVPAEQFWA